MKPRRSNLSVPGHVAKMHARAADSQADVVMLDLEDSVPFEAKEAARQQVIDSLLHLDWVKKTVTVRINGLDTVISFRDFKCKNRNCFIFYNKWIFRRKVKRK